MLPHIRFWWFILLAVVFLLLATALGRSQSPNGATPAQPEPPAVTPPDPAPAQQPKVAPPPAPARTPTPTMVPRALEKTPVEKPEVVPEPSALALALATLALHTVATVIALRIGLKIFYENTLFGGFCMIVLIDTLVVAALLLCAPLSDGFTALWGPQVITTALVMVLTVHHYGFSKDRFTVMPSVFVTKAFGFFAEVALRMLFLDSVARLATKLDL